MRKIAAAVIIGLLIAGAFTHITYSCRPIDGAAGCASWDKAVMHPADLLKNKQNSLVRFAGFFVINSFFSYVIIQQVAERKHRLKKEKE